MLTPSQLHDDRLNKTLQIFKHNAHEDHSLSYPPPFFAMIFKEKQDIANR